MQADKAQFSNDPMRYARLACLFRALFFHVLMLGSLCAWADTYVLKPQHRLPEELAQLIQQQWGAQIVVSAFADQLIISATPQQIKNIRQLIEQLDKPAEQLLLTLRLKEQRQQQIDSVETQLTYCKNNVCLGNVPQPASEGVQLQVGSKRINKNSSGQQQVRVVSGRSAFMSIGQSVPIENRVIYQGSYGADTYKTREYRDVNQGFYIVPRLLGSKVILDISVHNDRVATAQRTGSKRHSVDSINTQRLVANVEGRLNEWIALGTQNQTESTQNIGVLNAERARLQQLAQYEIYVEKISQ